MIPRIRWCDSPFPRSITGEHMNTGCKGMLSVGRTSVNACLFVVRWILSTLPLLPLLWPSRCSCTNKLSTSCTDQTLPRAWTSRGPPTWSSSPSLTRPQRTTGRQVDLSIWSKGTGARAIPGEGERGRVRQRNGGASGARYLPSRAVVSCLC